MAGITIKGPLVGLPEGMKATGQRVDFKENQFILAIETKGVRVAWARAGTCPCVPTETGQADPNCVLCKGLQYFYFRPTDYASSIPADALELTAVQTRIMDDNEAVVIRAVATSVARTIEDFDKLGEWAFGSSFFTVRPENRLGHRDRLVMLDAVLPHSQSAEVSASGLVQTRWPAIAVSILRSLTTVYEEDAHYEVQENGDIQFLPGHAPAGGTRVGVHYDHHPQLLVWEHMNAFRDSLKTFKTADPTTPLGDPQQLPIRVLAKLEWLVE